MRRLALLPLILLVGSAAAATAQDAKPITIDWIFGDEGESIGALPTTFWASDGSLLLADRRKPKAERTIERLQAEAGTRLVAVDAKAALEGLRGVMGAGAKDAPDSLAWPASLDGAGRRGVYVYGGDVFLLDLGASRFDRLTATTDEEESPRLSPDGTKVAFVRANDVYVVDVASRKESRLTTDGSATVLNGKLSWVYWEEIFSRNDIGYWWSEDSQALAFLRSDEASVSKSVFTDFSPASPRVIEQRYPKAGGTNPSVRLGVVDVASGKTVWADTSAVAYEYLVQVKWHPDGRVAFETMNRAQDRADVYLLDRATGAASHVLTETDPAWLYTVDFEFLKDGTVVATSERSGQTQLYRYDGKGQLLKTLTSGDGSVRGPSGFQESALDAMTVDEAKGLVYFSARPAGTTDRQLFRVGLDGAGLQRLSKEDGFHVVDWSPDGRFYVDRWSSRSSPPSMTLHAADGSRKAVLAEPGAGRLGKDFRYPEVASIPAADGRMLNAHIMRPAGFDPKKRYPLIVHVYGEPNAPLVQNRWGGTNEALYSQVLSDAGYVVASIDSRIAAGGSKADVSLALRQAGGDSERDDLQAAVRWLKKQPGIDATRVGIWGWSGGGTTTLLMMTRSTEFKAGISVAPVTDRAYYDTKYAEAFMKTPQANPEGYDKVSLVKTAKDLHGRLLLVFGSYDDNVHPQNSLHFLDELIKAGKEVDMMVYPMRKHGISDRAARRHLYRKMLAFWKANL